MKAPIRLRGGIPFFYNKTETEFQKDPYERYDEMVVKQSALHLVDEAWGSYPWQAVLDFADRYYPTGQLHHILEIGCGVGRWIGQLAQRHPTAECWGIDYSYQMLKRAREFWIEGKQLLFDLTNRGYAHRMHIKGHQLSNLRLGLAKASDLPFATNSQDLVLNSFLLDRMDNPARGMEEMYRVLKPGGKLIMVTPLNFNQAAHWEKYYPPIKLYHLFLQIGFKILDWQEDIFIWEPLDLHGNSVNWKCLGLVAGKTH